MSDMCSLCELRPRGAFGACAVCNEFVKAHVGPGKAIAAEKRGSASNIKLVMDSLGVDEHRARILLGLSEEASGD